MEKNKGQEQDVLDFDDNIHMENKVDLDAHINSVLIQAKYALTKDDVKAGFIQYWVIIEHLVTLCKAKNYLPDNFNEDIETYKKSKELQSIRDEVTKNVRIANKKLDLILPIIASKKVATEPLKL